MDNASSPIDTPKLSEQRAFKPNPEGIVALYRALLGADGSLEMKEKIQFRLEKGARRRETIARERTEKAVRDAELNR
jgi:hypothetical protein